MIPDGATVVSDISLMAYLVPDHEVYWLGNEGDPPPDYIVVDRISASWSDGPDEADVQAENRHPGTDYQVILDAGGYQVAERR